MAKPPHRVPAGIYCRISDDRTGAGLGVERQRKDCARLASKLGWVVEDTYIDNDISAYSGKRRPEYLRLLGDIQDGRINKVIVWHPDRLNRSPLELEGLIAVLEQNSVDVHSVTSGVLDLSTPTGRAVARTLGAWARFESEHKSERIKAKLRELALSGRPGTSGKRPYGYTFDWMTIVEDEATIIREAMRRFLGGESLHIIAQSLNARGIPTSDDYTRWKGSRVGRLLTNGRIAGWRDRPVPKNQEKALVGEFLARGVWPAIVSKQSVHRARLLIRDDTKRPGSHRRWLLSDIAVCGRCGFALVSFVADTPTRRYYCSDGPYRPRRCGRVSISHRAEDTVTEQLHAAVAEGLIERIISSGVDVCASARAAHREVERQMKNLRRDRADGAVSDRDFRSQMTTLVYVKISTTRVVDDIERLGDLRELSAESFPLRWSTADVSYQRSLLRALTEQILIRPSVTRAGHYYADRVVISWRA